MELIIYQGGPPGREVLDGWARRAAEAGVGLHMTVCNTRAQVEEVLTRGHEDVARTREALLPFWAADGICPIRLSEVCYFKGAGHKIIAGFTDGRTLCSKTHRIPAKAVLEPYLARGLFLQTSRATFVNLEQIATVTAAGVTLRNGEWVGISQAYYRLWLNQCRAMEPMGSPAAGRKTDLKP